MAQPAKGAMHLIGAASWAAAVTMIVYSMAPASFRRS